MLITVLKPKEAIEAVAKGKVFVVTCEGCKEVHFPEHEALALTGELKPSGAVITEYVCNPDNLKVQVAKHMDKITAADTVLVLACGVGVQTVSDNFKDKKVFAACDTLPLPGGQGVTPLEVGCDQCGECYLNGTGGICPITACSKSLVNGQCGGCKDGKCEVDKEMQCGWERIYKRLEKLGLLDEMRYPAKMRNFNLMYEENK